MNWRTRALRGIVCVTADFWQSVKSTAANARCRTIRILVDQNKTLDEAYDS
jgi:hypothetical protein